MIKRLPRIVAAYLAASVASGFVLALCALILPLAGTALEGRGQVGLSALLAILPLWLVVGGRASLFVVVLAVVPAAILIAIAETARLRSAAFYAAGGAIVGIACWAVFLREDGLLPMPGFAFSLAPGRTLVTAVLVLVAGLGGLTGGLVYWRIAGRAAGTP